MRAAEKVNLLLCKSLAMTSFGVFVLLLSEPAEQFTLHVSMKYNIPNRHATLTSDCLMLTEKMQERKTISAGNL